MPNPLISVVLPTYRAENWIAEALGSIATVPEAEHVECILLDSSPDERTIEVASGFVGQLELTILRRPNQGWQKKTNEGFRRARADWVCSLHHDDRWCTNRVSVLQSLIRENLHASMIVGRTWYIDHRGVRIGSIGPPLSAGFHDSGSCLPTLLIQNTIAVPDPLFRKAAVLAVGGLDESLPYTADWDLYLKMASAGALLVHDRATTEYRLHRSSITMRSAKEPSSFLAQHTEVIDRHVETLDESRRAKYGHLARTSARINTALAVAALGKQAALLTVVQLLLRLSPSDLFCYFRLSRIAARLGPRLRLLSAAHRYD